MSKRSGFAVKITAFIEADPKDAMSMSIATDTIINLQGVLQEHHMLAIVLQSRFMLSKDIPDEPLTTFPSDEPKAAQAVPTVTNVGDGSVTSSTVRSDQLPPGTNFTPTDQLPIPPQLDRRKA